MEIYGIVNTGTYKNRIEEGYLLTGISLFIYVGVVELADTSDLSPDAL